jgi:hypothetical protein
MAIGLSCMPITPLSHEKRMLFGGNRGERNFSGTQTELGMKVNLTARGSSSTTTSVHFDHVPSDSELTHLLPVPNQVAPFKVIESDPMFLRVRPGLMPIKFIGLSMVFGAAVITSMMIFFGRDATQSLPFAIVFWGIVASFWLLIIPVCLGVVFLVNYQVAESEDFFRVDLRSQTLELCREDSTVLADEILAFTEVGRYYRSRSDKEWLRRRQTGVLVRAADGGTQLYALIDGESNSPLADRLASIFHVPIRRVSLSMSESQELNDFYC